MGDRRFDRMWDRWDARIAGGTAADTALDESPDADLVAMLAAPAGETRRRERNVIASALANRIGRAKRESTAQAQARWEHAFHEVAQANALVAASSKLAASAKRLLESKR